MERQDKQNDPQRLDEGKDNSHPEQSPPIQNAIVPGSSRKRERETSEHQIGAKIKRTLSEAAYLNRGTLLQQKTTPWFMRNILTTLRDSVIGKYRAGFTEFTQSVFHKTVLLVIEQVPENIINGKQTDLKQIVNNFSNKTVFLDNVPFGEEVKSTYHFSSPSLNEDSYSILFPPSKQVRVSAPQMADNSKLRLLTKPFALISEVYPLSKGIAPFSKSDNFRYSKHVYDAVTGRSPLFAVDCEYSRDAKIISWMALVNEDCQTVYEFKGPGKANKIQKELYKRLPSDAILCGQSLNCDLRVLETIHPYCVDTSLLFRTCENKISLKELSETLLGERIQTTSRHSPIEDAVATMKLVKKKLNAITTDPSESSDDENVLKNSHYYTHGLFPLIDTHSKRFTIVGRREDIDVYTPDFISTRATKIPAENVLETTKQNINNNDFVLAHLCAEETNPDYQEVISEVYNSCPLNTLFTAILTPKVTETATFRECIFFKKEKKQNKKLEVKKKS